MIVDLSPCDLIVEHSEARLKLVVVRGILMYEGCTGGVAKGGKNRHTENDPGTIPHDCASRNGRGACIYQELEFESIRDSEANFAFENIRCWVTSNGELCPERGSIRNEMRRHVLQTVWMCMNGTSTVCV